DQALRKVSHIPKEIRNDLMEFFFIRSLYDAYLMACRLQTTTEVILIDQDFITNIPILRKVICQYFRSKLLQAIDLEIDFHAIPILHHLHGMLPIEGLNSFLVNIQGLAKK